MKAGIGLALALIALAPAFGQEIDLEAELAKAQAELSSPDKPGLPLALKCSIHQGPCLAINQNDRMDYFGTTVNICARLCALSTGGDIVVSPQILRDPEVAALLARPGTGLSARADAATLRGAGDSAYEFWRISR